MRHSLIVLALSLNFAANVWCAATVILTRHAEVSPEGDDPSLTVQGQSRAKLLANMLRDIPLDAIYVSDSKRTQQTAKAVADRHHITCQKKTEAIDLANAIRERTFGTVLIVGHSNTVPQTISLLGGPSYQIGEGEFDNLFILTISQGQVSVVRLRYGSKGPAPAFGASERTSTMQISFVKSGGLSGALTRVQGTINLKDGQPEINGDSTYHRKLAPPEIEMLRAGAEPGVLSQAATQLADKQTRGMGMGDLEHYTITVKTSDGKTHDVTLNTSGSSSEMEGVPPAAAKFLSWLQQEAQNILAEKLKAK